MLKKLFLTLATLGLATGLAVNSAVYFPVFGEYADGAEYYLKKGSFGAPVTSACLPAGRIYGESRAVTVDYESILKDFSARHLFSERTEDGESFYAYSKRINSFVIINGEKVNIHYFKGKNGNRVGTPIIFGGY